MKEIFCRCGVIIEKKTGNQFGNSCTECQKARKSVTNKNAAIRKRALNLRGRIPVPEWMNNIIQKANMNYEFRKDVPIDWLNHWAWLLQHRKDTHSKCLAPKTKGV